MNRHLSLFLTFLFIFFLSATNASEHKDKFSNLLPKPYSYIVKNLLGSYYSIGTFSFLENANGLKLRLARYKPLVTMISNKNKIFYRVIVGPINYSNKVELRSALINSGLNDVWLVQINGPTKLIVKSSDIIKKLADATRTKLKSKENSNLASDFIKVKTRDDIDYLPGKTFTDCKVCPKQVIVPEGNFIMGEVNGGLTEDAEAINVAIAKSFSISKYEISFGLWDACLSDGGCSGYRPSDEGWGRGARPVINVNREDVLSYLNWITKKTGQLYRLPSEAEWEYASRAGTNTAFWWGRKPGVNRAVCQDCGSIYDGERTAKVGSFSTNKFGLFDTSGNVWEWVEDCYNKDAYKIHKLYPKPFLSFKNSKQRLNCSRILRGGGWNIMSMGITPSFRYMSMPKVRSKFYGFRVVREIE